MEKKCMKKKCMKKKYRIKEYRIKVKWLYLVAIVLCMVGTTSCTKMKEKQKAGTENTGTENANVQESESSVVDIEDENKVSVWVTYWDTSGLLEELQVWKPYIKQINYFAAYFKEDRSLFVPKYTEETRESISRLFEDREFPTYLTIVNDQELEEGTSTLKSTDLLYSLFESEETMRKHSNDILQVTLDGGYDGIEIDYEAIRDDMVLWEKYLTFLHLLTKLTKEYNLSLRVLLEPSTPVDDIQFPEGIEYIMMCYNLYGYGTKPGPKANRDFLIELADKMKKVSNRRGYALATGGFDFSSDGTTAAVTLVEAMAVQSTEGDNIHRDEQSQCIVFTYTKQNMAHEVWYADGDTLRYWTKVLKEEGERNISIWRLGGTILK